MGWPGWGWGERVTRSTMASLRRSLSKALEVGEAAAQTWGRHTSKGDTQNKGLGVGMYLCLDTTGRPVYGDVVI